MTLYCIYYDDENQNKLQAQGNARCELAESETPSTVQKEELSLSYHGISPACLSCCIHGERQHILSEKAKGECKFS